MILSDISCYPTLFLTNARSVLPKLDELRLILSALNIDIAVILESWLYKDIVEAKTKG